MVTVEFSTYIFQADIPSEIVQLVEILNVTQVLRASRSILVKQCGKAVCPLDQF